MLGPAIHISPIVSRLQGVCFSGSTIRISWSGGAPHSHQLGTGGRYLLLPGQCGRLSMPAHPPAECRIRVLMASRGDKGCFRETITGQICFFSKAAGFKSRGEAVERLPLTGSAPLKATSQQLRSSSDFCSEVIFRTQRS